MSVRGGGGGGAGAHDGHSKVKQKEGTRKLGEALTCANKLRLESMPRADFVSVCSSNPRRDLKPECTANVVCRWDVHPVVVSGRSAHQAMKRRKSLSSKGAAYFALLTSAQISLTIGGNLQLTAAGASPVLPKCSLSSSCAQRRSANEKSEYCDEGNCVRSISRWSRGV